MTSAADKSFTFDFRVIPPAVKTGGLGIIMRVFAFYKSHLAYAPFINQLLRKDETGGVTANLPGHETLSALFNSRYDFFAFGHSGSKRFFANRMTSRRKGLYALFRMEMIWRGNDNHIKAGLINIVFFSEYSAS